MLLHDALSMIVIDLNSNGYNYSLNELRKGSVENYNGYVYSGYCEKLYVAKLTSNLPKYEDVSITFEVDKRNRFVYCNVETRIRDSVDIEFNGVIPLDIKIIVNKILKDIFKSNFELEDSYIKDVTTSDLNINISIDKIEYSVFKKYSIKLKKN